MSGKTTFYTDEEINKIKAKSLTPEKIAEIRANAVSAYQMKQKFGAKRIDRLNTIFSGYANFDEIDKYLIMSDEEYNHELNWANNKKMQAILASMN